MYGNTTPKCGSCLKDFNSRHHLKIYLSSQHIRGSYTKTAKSSKEVESVRDLSLLDANSKELLDLFIKLYKLKEISVCECLR